MSDELFSYNEIDFILPAHKFKLRFSYITKEGLPFIREFVLRLLHVCALEPLELATYFNFSEREADEAITDLLQRGEVQYDDNGKIRLTPQSERYFPSIGSSPEISTLEEAQAQLIFELGAFNCLGLSHKYPREEWGHGIELTIDNEIKATSEQEASKHFQKQFYKILDDGYITNIPREGKDRARIYSMGSVKKIGSVPHRLTVKFSIDADGFPAERNDFDSLENSEAAHQSITTSLSTFAKRDNLTELIQSMDLLGDTWTSQLFNQVSIDVRTLIINRTKSRLGDDTGVPILGQLYSEKNWMNIKENIERILPKIKNSATGKKLDIVWLAPSDRFWRTSYRLPESAISFVGFVQNLKKEQSINAPIIYLPVHDKHDNQWNRDLNGQSGLSNITSNIHGLLEGFLNGNVEVIVVENNFVAVCYHVVKADSLPVTMPLGFLSTNLSIINSVQKVVFEYVKGMSSFEEPNSIGVLKSNK